jgi:DNA-binding transcriptional regulator YbjK
VTSRVRSESTRNALLQATLDVVADYGVRGVTHRRVAAASGMSLGLTSYHFVNIDDLILEAFRLFVRQTTERYQAHFDGARDEDSMIDAAMAMVDALEDSPRDRALLYELYAQAVREDPYRQLIASWSGAARAGVERLYSPRTARFLEAAWEGVNAQMIQGRNHHTEDELRALFRLILSQEKPDAH